MFLIFLFSIDALEHKLKKYVLNLTCHAKYCIKHIILV